MDTSQFVIRDHQWAKMEPHWLGLKAHPGRTGSDPRLFMKAVFWIARIRIALRTDKTDTSFAVIINACAALLNSK